MMLKEKFDEFLKKYTRENISKELKLSGKDILDLKAWFENLSNESDILEYLKQEYKQSCDQMRHWDTIQWVLNGTFLISGFQVIFFALKESKELWSLLGISILLIGYYVYSSFRKRAMKTLTFVLLIETLLNFKSQTFALSESEYVSAYASFLQRRTLKEAVLAIISIGVIITLLYSLDGLLISISNLFKL